MDTQIYKEKLETELTAITTELKTLGIQNTDSPSDWIPTPDAIDRHEADANVVGDRSEDWQEKRGTLDLLETRFNNLKRALQKISDGTFGTCEICGQQIETDRLTVNPAARTCKQHLDDEAKLQQ